jgi:hypothetical protein
MMRLLGDAQDDLKSVAYVGFCDAAARRTTVFVGKVRDPPDALQLDGENRAVSQSPIQPILS